MATNSTRITFQVPFRDRVINQQGLLSQTWAAFFRLLQDVVAPLGIEKSVQLENEQTEWTDIPGLVVNLSKAKFAFVKYFIQRVTAVTNPVELLEGGFFYLVYRPTQEIWEMVSGSPTGPDVSGVTLRLKPGSSGQVQYKSTLVDGSPKIFKINFRIETLAG